MKCLYKVMSIMIKKKTKSLALKIGECAEQGNLRIMLFCSTYGVWRWEITCSSSMGFAMVQLELFSSSAVLSNDQLPLYSVAFTFLQLYVIKKA